jgi:hypothetical protein
MLNLLEMFSRKYSKIVGKVFVYGAIALAIFYSLKRKSYSPCLMQMPSPSEYWLDYSRFPIPSLFWSSYRSPALPPLPYWHGPESID